MFYINFPWSIWNLSGIHSNHIVHSTKLQWEILNAKANGTLHNKGSKQYSSVFLTKQSTSHEISLDLQCKLIPVKTVKMLALNTTENEIIKTSFSSENYTQKIHDSCRYNKHRWKNTNWQRWQSFRSCIDKSSISWVLTHVGWERISTKIKSLRIHQLEGCWLRPPVALHSHYRSMHSLQCSSSYSVKQVVFIHISLSAGLQKNYSTNFHKIQRKGGTWLVGWLVS